MDIRGGGTSARGTCNPCCFPALSGEGGIFVDIYGESLVNNLKYRDLASRDLVSRAFMKYMHDNPDIQICGAQIQMFNQNKEMIEKAKNIIPGGNMLLSKKTDLVLPNGGPTDFSKTKGCKVFDLDKNMFFDVSLMGVGTNIVGYSNNKVYYDVKKVVPSIYLASELSRNKL